eukprot:181504_1
MCDNKDEIEISQHVISSKTNTNFDEDLTTKMLTFFKSLEDEKLKWSPHFEFTIQYIGNGFVNIIITECNCCISEFELKYLFSNNINNKINESLFGYTTFEPRKINDENILLIRVPQKINDYYFIFQIRGYAERGMVCIYYIIQKYGQFTTYIYGGFVIVKL